MKILVVDDHALVRAGLGQVLQGLDPQQPTLVLEAENCASAFALADHHPDIDLVLLDYHLPDMNGSAALEILGRQHPELPVVILSGSANPSITRRVLSQGAMGFVTKSGLSEALLQAIRQVLTGAIYIPPEFAGPAEEGTDAPSVKGPIFTQRQEDVLQLLLAGCSNRDIGERLSLSDETVKNHITSILRGFGVKTRTQAALEAGRWGYDRSAPLGR